MDGSPVSLIAKKRDGGEHSREEIEALIGGLMSGAVTDYQMTAWLMAAYLRGLSDSEMVSLTLSMLHSGKTLTLRSVPGVKVDKHSTGGVGDKLSIPLAPLVAAAGLCVPMISGRGLGHTGGTLDKLESIRGYRTCLSVREFERVLKTCGVSLIGQTPSLAPADRKIYALRDVTGTVACRPLIVASILSKKLAAGLDGLVFDVKVGRGAFMKDEENARRLMKSLVHVGRKLGTPSVALMTKMDAPLGRTIGNALEIRESLELLNGQGPADTAELLLRLGSEMLLLGKIEKSMSAARRRLVACLKSGAALEKFEKMVELHGGDPRVIGQPNRLPRAPEQRVVLAPRGGFVVDIDSLALAEAALDLGAGRKRAEDKIDPAVGFEVLAPVGSEVRKGDPLARIHTRTGKPDVRSRVLKAFELGVRPPRPSPLVVERWTKS